MQRRVTQDHCNALPETGYIRIDQLVRDKRHPDLPKPIPVSAATLWRMVRCGDFPAPIKLSANVTAWRAEEIHAWIVRDGWCRPESNAGCGNSHQSSVDRARPTA